MLPLLPQIVEFTNQAVIALSNAFQPQVYSDVTPSTTNPATIVGISAISVDGFGVVTITTSGPHNIDPSEGVGANVYLTGITDAAYNTNGHGASAFPTIAIPDGTHVKIFNPSVIGQGSSSGGTLTVTTVPIISTFVPAFPVWAATEPVAVNTAITPTVPNTFYFTAVQGGTTGSGEPTWPTVVGNRVADGTVVWVCAGLVNSAAPPPAGAAHIGVYAGSLWVWDTSPINTANGLDGPCSLRMSDVNQANSWNPINQAFLDKDDGTEGMGLAVFTISAQGIPPEGSMIAFKLYSTFQIVGVFGSSNFAIQRVITDMGCYSPRSIQFIPGYGIGRYAHLGVAVFDGVNDRVVSESVRPYLFPTNDLDLVDITAMDATNQALAWGTQTSNPPMYVFAIPVGTSGGQLTRFLCFDLVLKAWVVIDPPFPLGCVAQARTSTANPVTLMGSFSDGTLQRWQADDVLWATSTAGSATPATVAGSFRTPTAASKDPEERLYCRRGIVIGQLGNQPPTFLTITPRINGVARTPQVVSLPSSGRFAVQASVGETSDLFDMIVAFSGDITIDATSFDLVPKALNVLAGFIS